MILINCAIKFIIFYKNCVFQSKLIEIMIIIILQLFLIKEI